MKQSNKKTLICVLLCALFCAVTAFAFAGCKKTEAAKKYAVIFMDGETQISEQTVEANKEAVKPADPTKESTVGEVYTFAGWSLTDGGETVTDFTIKADTTFYAVYTSATRQYKVTFMNGSEKLSESDVDYNGVAAAPTQTPAKESTVDTVFAFAGWSLTENGETVTDFTIKADTTFYAVYTPATRQYKVTFMNGTEKLSENDVDYNTTAAAPATNPSKPSDAGNDYTFAGWALTENGETVTDFTIKADTTFYAVYTSVTRKYKVTFMNGSEKLSESDVDYNGVAAAPTQTPAKESTVDTVFAFAGWSLTDGGEKVDELKITGDTTFYAVYTPSVRKYNVQFIGDDLDVTVSVNARENVPALKDEEGALGRKIVGYYSDEGFGTEFDTEAEILKDTVVYVKLSDYVYFNGAMMSKFTGTATKTLNADGTLTLLGADKDKYIHQKELNLSVEGANRVEIRAKQNGVYRLDLYLFGNYTLGGNVATGTDYDADKGGFRYRGVDASFGYSVVKDGEYVIMTYDLSYANGNTAKNLVFNVINGFRIDIVGVNDKITDSSIMIDYVKIIKE